MIRTQKMYRRMTQWRRLNFWQAKWRDELSTEVAQMGPGRHLLFGLAARAELWDIESQLPADPDEDDVS
jgi:hypothetical protein